MEAAAILTPVKGYPHSKHQSSRSFNLNRSSNQIIISRNGGYNSVKSKKLRLRTSAVVAEVSAVISTDPASQVEITWQIVVGALAGVTPFVVAGIEFSKRIVQQRLCEVCNGSGLILKDDKSYTRCPGCGGFLPWQSWRRFFTG